MFYDKLIELCELHGIAPSTVAEAIGLTKSSATYWKKGALPKVGTVQKIANYFQVPITFFLIDDNETNLEEDAKDFFPDDPKEQELYKTYISEGSVMRQYLKQIKKAIKDSNKVILQKTKKLTDYALTQQLLIEFSALNRAGKARVIEYSALLNDSGDYIINSDKWESDNTPATPPPDEKEDK